MNIHCTKVEQVAVQKFEWTVGEVLDTLYEMSS